MMKGEVKEDNEEKKRKKRRAEGMNKWKVKAIH